MFRRVSIFVALAALAAFGYELQRTSGYLSVPGEVVSVERARAGWRGDPSRFIVQYTVRGSDHTVSFRRGVHEQYGRYRGLDVGDPVPVLHAPAAPDRAVVDSSSERFPLSLSFAALLAIVWIAGAISVHRARRDDTA